MDWQHCAEKTEHINSHWAVEIEDFVHSHCHNEYNAEDSKTWYLLKEKIEHIPQWLLGILVSCQYIEYRNWGGFG